MLQSNILLYLVKGSLLFWEEGIGEYAWAGKAYFICSAVSNRHHSNNIYNETSIEWLWELGNILLSILISVVVHSKALGLFITWRFGLFSEPEVVLLLFESPLLYYTISVYSHLSISYIFIRKWMQH